MTGREVSKIQQKNGCSRARKVRLWSFKLGIWFLAMLMAGSFLVAAVFYVIYQNPAQAVNLLLQELVVGQEVTVEKVILSQRGMVKIEGLKIRQPGAEGLWLHLEEVAIDYDWEELKNHRHVKSLRLKQPVIRIDEAVVKSWSESAVVFAGKKGGSTAKEDFDLGFLEGISDEIIVEKGHASVAWPALPPVSFNFTLKAKGLGSSVEGEREWISDDPIKLELSRFKMGENEGWASLEELLLEAQVSRNAKRIEVRQLEIDQPKVALNPEVLALFASAANKKKTIKQEPQKKASGVEVAKSKQKGDQDFSLKLNKLRVSQGHFSLRGFDGLEGRALLPDVIFQLSLDWKGIQIIGDKLTSIAPLTLNLEELLVDAAQEKNGAAPLLQAESLTAIFSPQAVMEEGQLHALTLQSPQVNLTSENLFRLGMSKNSDPQHSKADKVGSGPEKRGSNKNVNEESKRKSFELDHLSIADGQLSIKGMQDRLWPDVKTGFSGEIRELKLGGEGLGVSSSAQQKINFSALEVSGAENKESDKLLVAKKIEVGFSIDELLGEGILERLRIQSPELVVSDDTIARWLPLTTKGKASEKGEVAAHNKEVPVKVSEEERFWQVRDLKVKNGRLALRVEKAFQGVPWTQTNFDVETLPFEFSKDKGAMQEVRYRMDLSGLRLRPQGFKRARVDKGAELKAGQRGEISERDVAFVRELAVEVTARGLQKDQHIESVIIGGGMVKLDDDFKTLLGMGGDKEEGVEVKKQEVDPVSVEQINKLEDGAEQTSGWSIGELGVNRTIVRLEAMVPQLEGVQFSIETTMKDVPLSSAGLLSRDLVQKVEIAGIELRDPYDGIRSAALLPTIFLKFSLAGLMKQEIEAIDILGPVLYIGEPLFNWIDYQRKYRKQNEGTALAPKDWEEPAVEGEDASEEKTAAKGSWNLKKINAHYGKMVIAPIGTPIGIVPFPFSVETNFEDGQIALNLEIPQEQYVYSLADLKLDLYGLSGNVDFNVPIKQKANNLVQTFKLDRLVWKQFDAEKIFVSVTYDANGIYGKLGGNAYEGYVNGEFNVYLKDLGKWDGWLAGTDVNMGPITQALAPENFVMEGKVSGKLVSGGKGVVFGTTTGELQAVTPGRIEITKLESVLEALPEEWTQLKRSLSKLALNGLKDFEYEKAEGSVDMLGRDGEISLDLSGATGSRAFHFFLHDWRKKKGTSKSAQVVSLP